MSGNPNLLQQTNDEVDEVLEIMRNNVDKVLERDTKIRDLDTRADALQAGAARFESNTTKLRRKFFWQGQRAKIILACVIVAIILIIIISVAVKYA